jgi:hypothetical protein
MLVELASGTITKELLKIMSYRIVSHISNIKSISPVSSRTTYLVLVTNRKQKQYRLQGDV